MDLMVKGEAIVRREAERSLVRRFRTDYERLAAEGGHAEAVRRLVATHKPEYDEVVRDARGRVRTRMTPPAA